MSCRRVRAGWLRLMLWGSCRSAETSCSISVTGLPRKTYGRQRAGNLTWCLGKSREPPWSFGKRDPTNFRRVISRHRGGATDLVALFSRVRALHVQYWLPQSSRRMAIRTPSASQSGQNHPRPEPQVIRAPLISALYAIERRCDGTARLRCVEGELRS